MLESEMHDADRRILNAVLRIPQTRLHMPEQVLNLYEKAQYARHATGGQGSLPEAVLMCICLIADAIELPQATPTKFGKLAVGTKMFLRVTAWEVVPVEFVGVKDPISKTYTISFCGELRTVNEQQLSLTDPRQASKPVPVTQKPVEAVEQVATEADDALAQQRSDALNRVKARWTVGKRVDACPPSQSAFTGTIVGHDKAGGVVVQHDDGSGLATVLADYLYPLVEDTLPAGMTLAADQPSATVSEPIETNDDEDDDESDVLPDITVIKAQWPKGTRADVCIPGSGEWMGDILAHGTGKMLGRVQVKPLDGSAAYRWVPVQHLYPVGVESLVGE